MRGVRSLLTVLGGAVLGVGLATVVAPDVAALVPVGAAVDALGNDYLFVAALGALAVGLVGTVLSLRAATGLDQATPPAAEGVPSGPRPGEAFDRVVRDGPGLRALLAGDERRRARDRLHEAAVRTEMRASNCTRETARERVATGEWTEDPAAAAFLGDEATPLRSRLAEALRGNATFRHRARRTADAVARRAGVAADRTGAEEAPANTEERPASVGENRARSEEGA